MSTVSSVAVVHTPTSSLALLFGQLKGDAGREFRRESMEGLSEAGLPGDGLGVLEREREREREIEKENKQTKHIYIYTYIYIAFALSAPSNSLL